MGENKMKVRSLLIAAIAALGVSSVQAHDAGYVVDSRDHVAKSGTNLCWRTGYWTPAMATKECDPDLAGGKAGMKPAGGKITLSADALFDYNKATLRNEGKIKLDALVARSKELKLEVIIAVGHADRIGNAKYNQALSQKRAASVKSYLVSKGVEANRVYTEGKGETQPVTGDKCKNMGAENGRNKKLINCLQPDRRVDIEVIGTK